MKKAETTIWKALAWIFSCVIIGVFLYGIFNYVTSITVYNNNENSVRSYEKLQSSFRDENYIFPDLSELDSGNNKYGIIMDGSTLRSKPQTFFVEVTYPHEICNIRYQVVTYLSAYSETELPESVRDKSTFSEAEYKGIPIHIQRTFYDPAVSIEYYFSLDEHHYCVNASYYTEKHLDSRELEGTLTPEEQQEVESVIYVEVEKIVHQMIDTVVVEEEQASRFTAEVVKYGNDALYVKVIDAGNSALSIGDELYVGVANGYDDYPYECTVEVVYSGGVIADDFGDYGVEHTISVSKAQTQPIIIPTVDEIRANGYPTNENGETYGPDVWEWTVTPDLSLVIADDGQEGYIRNSEADSGVTTPEEAANYKPSNRVLNVYLHDGVTVIGTFTLGGD